MTTFLLKNQPTLENIITNMDRKILEHYFLKGKIRKNMPGEELKELINIENFFMCSENFNDVCRDYEENNLDKFFINDLVKTWNLLQKAAADVSVLKG